LYFFFHPYLKDIAPAFVRILVIMLVVTGATAWMAIVYSYVEKPLVAIKKWGAGLLANFFGLLLPRFAGRVAKGSIGFLIKNWLTLLLSGMLPLYIFFVTVEKREPVFLIDPQQDSVVSGSTQASEPISKMRFYLWNRGKKSIRHENILEPFRLILQDPKGVILGCKLLHVSRDAVRWSMKKSDLAAQEVLFDFYILERNDGVTGEVTYRSPAGAQFSVIGMVEDSKGVLLERDLVAELWWLDYLDVVAAALGAWLFVMFILGRKRRSGENLTINERAILVVACLLGIAVCVWYGNYRDDFGHPERDFVFRSIPAQILPSWIDFNERHVPSKDPDRQNEVPGLQR
jgi:hypothetical protein